MFREYLNIGEELWSWDTIFAPMESYVEDLSKHEMKFLEPRVDFFAKHESQFNRE